MPSMRFPVPSIESLMPSVDPRTSAAAHLIDGRNFMWDSKGPKSGFSTKQLTPFPFYAPRDVQGKRIQDRTFVFTQDTILEWRTNSPFMWDMLQTFPNPIPEKLRLPWQGIYMNGYVYIAHVYRGFYSAPLELGTKKLWLRLESSDSILGLPEGIRGMEIVRGRAILVTDKTIYWGNTGDLSDLTPGLGGAGFQIISNYVKGTFLALTGFQDGFVVWTTEGAILAQFIDGDEVWRFDPLTSNERPMNPWCTVELSNGASAFLSRKGLFLTGSGENPKAWTELFNEFFREYMKDIVGNSRTWRLEYDDNREMIYLSESTNNSSFSRTFVLSPTLNKWGMFSDEVHGFLPLTPDLYGYADRAGVPQYFTEAFNREVDPPNELGLNLLFPRLEKQLKTPSSSAVSHGQAREPLPISTARVLSSGGWYLPESTTRFSPYPGGMDSWIEVGYLRPNELNMAADAFTEIQEVYVGSIPVAAPELDFTTMWKADWFYGEHEDWNEIPIIIHGDMINDHMIMADSIEDLQLSQPSVNEDLLTQDYPEFTYSEEIYEDWDVMTGSEDWNRIVSAYPALDYQLVAQSSQDGITFVEYPVVLSRFDSASKTFATMTSGTLHKLRFAAEEVNEYYHVQALEITITYGGQLG